MIKELKPIYQLLDNYRDEIPCDAPEACRNCTDPDCGHEWRYTDALIKLMGMYVMLHRENERRKMTIRCYDEALNAMLDRKTLVEIANGITMGHNGKSRAEIREYYTKQSNTQGK